jgi:tRNA nucleotidyltransferase/poly(A) polymerase
MCPGSQDAMMLDPNGIMRYFKAVSMFAHPHVKKEDLQFIAKNVHRLADAKDDERVQMNLISIQKSPHRQLVLDLMCKLGVDQYLPFVVCEEE